MAFHSAITIYSMTKRVICKTPSLNLKTQLMERRCMKVTVALALLVFSICGSSLAEAQYLQGPRGGCYTFTKSGNKRYVDHSLCADTPTNFKSSKITADDLAAERANLVSKSRITAPTTSKDYQRGPRGGCYYLTTGGNKQYVERSLCD